MLPQKYYRTHLCVCVHFVWRANRSISSNGTKCTHYHIPGNAINWMRLSSEYLLDRIYLLCIIILIVTVLGATLHVYESVIVNWNYMTTSTKTIISPLRTNMSSFFLYSLIKYMCRVISYLWNVTWSKTRKIHMRLVAHFFYQNWIKHNEKKKTTTKKLQQATAAATLTNHRLQENCNKNETKRCFWRCFVWLVVAYKSAYRTKYDSERITTKINTKCFEAIQPTIFGSAR